MNIAFKIVLPLQKANLAETYYKEGKMGVNQIATDISVSKMPL
jgi:hypothetical protein